MFGLTWHCLLRAQHLVGLSPGRRARVHADIVGNKEKQNPDRDPAGCWGRLASQEGTERPANRLSIIIIKQTLPLSCAVCVCAFGVERLRTRVTSTRTSNPQCVYFRDTTSAPLKLATGNWTLSDPTAPAALKGATGRSSNCQLVESLYPLAPQPPTSFANQEILSRPHSHSKTRYNAHNPFRPT